MDLLPSGEKREVGIKFRITIFSMATSTEAIPVMTFS
jgi:hypothetical protein